VGVASVALGFYGTDRLRFSHRLPIVAGTLRDGVRWDRPTSVGLAGFGLAAFGLAAFGTVRLVRVLVLRHHAEDQPGFIGDAFEALGARVDTYLYPDEGPLPDVEGYDNVVVLGSSASVYETTDWITEELEWLRKVRRPVLGICFGAQLLSASFGGSVERSPVYEIGWVTVEPVAPELASQDEPPRAERATLAGEGRTAVPAPVISRGPWFQFHGDRCVLPPEARLLAQDPVGPQAFLLGAHLGVQFHPEVDTSQLRRWLEHGGREVVERTGNDPEALLAETARREPEARARAQELVDSYVQYTRRVLASPTTCPYTL
jgi:GMP synthase-like glutamine amidotransferase